MSSESAKEELPKIKMRIKFCNPSSSEGKQPQGGGGGGEDHGVEVVKKEVVQEQNYNSEQQIPKSGDQDLTPPPHSSKATPQTPSPSTPSNSSMGKRKKKPKEMHGEFLCQFTKRIKKSHPVSKANIVVSEHAPKSSSCKPGKASSNGLHSPVEVKTRAMIRAEELQSTLDSEFPSFTKLMVRSHVSNGFWMGIPGQFCKSHLPRKDTTVTVKNDSGEEFQIKYIAEKTGLSAGWRKFVVAHKLLEGDVLIFQLVEPNKFKVFVVRANDLKEVDGALSLLNLESHIEQNDTEKYGEENSQQASELSIKKRKRLKSLQYVGLKKKNKKARPGKLVLETLQSAEQFKNGYKETDLTSSCTPAFKDVKNFEDFTIMVDGLCIDSELPEHIRIKYFELCSIKTAFLHAHLLQGLNSKLVAGIICETVNIADTIKTCTLTTSRDEFANWEKTLKSFEFLGMSVGFLRARVRKLVRIAFESDGALETRKYIEAKLGKIQTEDDIRDLESKIVELKEASGKFSADIGALKCKAESYELKFQEEVEAPW